MPGIGAMFRPNPQPAGRGMPQPPFSQKFDFNKYIEACQIFGKDFFGRQVPEFFKNPKPHLQNFSKWWNAQKQYEQLAYGGIAVGSLMMVVGIVLIIVI